MTTPHVCANTFGATQASNVIWPERSSEFESGTRTGAFEHESVTPLAVVFDTASPAGVEGEVVSAVLASASADRFPSFQTEPELQPAGRLVRPV
jgi:hypothetical protein